MRDIDEKLARLRRAIRDLGSAVVAFSAGVDSTFLLRVAHDMLGDRAVAVTMRLRSLPAGELGEASGFCRANGIRHAIIDCDELGIPGFAENPPDRCYACKKSVFSKIAAYAREQGLAAVLEGSNTDDDGDYRPGRRAIAELGVMSPLHDAGLSKSEIRILSREMGLATAEKPSFACLASRFPYGERITAEGLEMVGRAEEWLRATFPGLGQLRVRCIAGRVARLEVLPEDMGLITANAAEVDKALRSFGFSCASLDLRGYRTGSMNEMLKQ